MMLKTANGRYLDSTRVVGYAALGSDTTWFIRAYLPAVTTLEGSSSDLVQLAGSYASESAAQAGLAKLASALGGFDTTDFV